MTRAALTTAILAATLAIAAGASGHAQVTMQPGGGVSCPGAYYAQRLDGRMMIMCPPPPVTKQQADEYGRQWWQAHDTEAARQKKAAHDSGRCNEKREFGQAYTRPPSCDD
jgi:hypothetical protein